MANTTTILDYYGGGKVRPVIQGGVISHYEFIYRFIPSPKKNRIRYIIWKYWNIDEYGATLYLD